jgi:hypothetical protein
MSLAQTLFYTGMNFESTIVLDRHRFDADPDPDSISILMPTQIKIRIRIGIKTMPIYMRILPRGLHMSENSAKLLLLFTARPVYHFFLFLSVANVSRFYVLFWTAC